MGRLPVSGDREASFISSCNDYSAARMHLQQVLIGTFQQLNQQDHPLRSCIKESSLKHASERKVPPANYRILSSKRQVDREHNE
jgi:hypothetical protein